MFTGIVERTGTVDGLTPGRKSAKLTVSAEGFFKDDNLGDSIAVDGVCLTIVDMTDNKATFDVSNETLERSILQGYKSGTVVNLEKALTPSTRMGGHIVQGHVDGVGKLAKMETSGDNVELFIDIPKELARYVVEKGSVTINGISLTAATVKGARISIAVVPHTMERTSLSALIPGSPVNLEVDIIGKYVEKLVLSDQENSVTEEFLKDHGFF